MIIDPIIVPIVTLFDVAFNRKGEVKIKKADPMPGQPISLIEIIAQLLIFTKTAAITATEGLFFHRFGFVNDQRALHKRIVMKHFFGFFSFFG